MRRDEVPDDEAHRDAARVLAARFRAGINERCLHPPNLCIGDLCTVCWQEGVEG